MSKVKRGKIVGIRQTRTTTTTAAGGDGTCHPTRRQIILQFYRECKFASLLSTFQIILYTKISTTKPKIDDDDVCCTVLKFILIEYFLVWNVRFHITNRIVNVCTWIDERIKLNEWMNVIFGGWTVSRASTVLNRWVFSCPLSCAKKKRRKKSCQAFV